jgi:serine/threonine protein kinase
LIGETHRLITRLDSKRKDSWRVEETPQCSCLHSLLVGDCLSSLEYLSTTSRTQQWRLSQEELSSSTEKTWEVSGHLTQEQIDHGCTEEFVSLIPIQNYLFGISLISSSSSFCCVGYLLDPHHSSSMSSSSSSHSNRFCQTISKIDLFNTQTPPSPSMSLYFSGRYRANSRDHIENGCYTFKVNENQVDLIVVVVNEKGLLQAKKVPPLPIPRLHNSSPPVVSREISFTTTSRDLAHQVALHLAPDFSDSQDEDTPVNSMRKHSIQSIESDMTREAATEVDDDDGSSDVRESKHSVDRVNQAPPRPSLPNYFVKDSEITNISELKESHGTFKGYYVNDTGTLTPVVIKLDSSLRDLEHEDRILKYLANRSSSNFCDCPSIKSFYFHSSPSPRYLVLESHGEDLRSYFRRGCRNKPTRLILAGLILEALANLHDYDLMHGDIKPSNILILWRHGEYFVKFCDFDSCCLLSKELQQQWHGSQQQTHKFPTLDGKLKYSAGWEAPEVHFGQPGNLDASQAIDIFSAGLLLHVLFQDSIDRHTTGLPIPSPSSLHSPPLMSDEEAKLARSKILRSQESIENYLKGSMTTARGGGGWGAMTIRQRLVSEMCRHDPTTRRSLRECHEIYHRDFSVTQQQHFSQTLQQENHFLKETLHAHEMTLQRIANEAMTVTTSRGDDLVSVIESLLEKTMKNVIGDSVTTLQQQAVVDHQETMTMMRTLQQQGGESSSEIQEVLRIVKQLDASQVILMAEFAEMRSSQNVKLQKLTQEIDFLSQQFGLFQHQSPPVANDPCLPCPSSSSLTEAFEKSLIMDLIVDRIKATLSQKAFDAIQLQQDNYRTSFLEIKEAMTHSLEQQVTLFSKFDLLLTHSTSLSCSCEDITKLVMESPAKITPRECCEMSIAMLRIISEFNQITFQNHPPPLSASAEEEEEEEEEQKLPEVCEEFVLKVEENLKFFQNSLSSFRDEREEDNGEGQEQAQQGQMLEMMKQIQELFQEQRALPDLIRQGVAAELEAFQREYQGDERTREIFKEYLQQFGGDMEMLLDGGTSLLKRSLSTIGTKVESIGNIQKAQVLGLLSFPQLFSLTLATPPPAAATDVTDVTVQGSANSAPRSNWRTKISSLSNFISRQLFDFYDLHFLCSLCGKRGARYSLSLTKKAVQDLMEGVSITLQVIEFLGSLLGIRIPHVSKVIQEIFGEIPETVRETVKGAMKLKKDVNKMLREGGGGGRRMAGAGEGENPFESIDQEYLRITSRSHQQNIRALLEKAKDPEASRSGLELVPHNNTLVWACSDPDEECRQCRADGMADMSLGGWGDEGEGESSRGHWSQPGGAGK